MDYGEKCSKVTFSHNFDSVLNKLNDTYTIKRVTKYFTFLVPNTIISHAISDVELHQMFFKEEYQPTIEQQIRFLIRQYYQKMDNEIQEGLMLSNNLNESVVQYSEEDYITELEHDYCLKHYEVVTFEDQDFLEIYYYPTFFPQSFMPIYTNVEAYQFKDGKFIPLSE